jgi:hypothetical protein
MIDRIVHDVPDPAMSAMEDRLLAAGGPWSFSNYADRAITSATIAYTGCHTQNRVAGNSDSGWATRTHIRTTAGRSRIRIHSYRSTHADTRADVLCD